MKSAYRFLRRYRLLAEPLEPRVLLASDLDSLGSLQCNLADHPVGCSCAACGSAPPWAAVGDRDTTDPIIDADGNVLYWDPIPAEVGEDFDDGGSAGGDILGGAGGETVPLSEIPLLHSDASAAKKIFLDFTGHTVSGTSWNNTYYDRQPIHAPAFDLDGDIFTFNTIELDRIFDIWERVSEDFAPFNVDVTTEEPEASVLTQGGQGIRALITSTVDDTRLGGTGDHWFGTAGGVAYVGTFSTSGDVPAWIFENHLQGSAKKIAEATSHEVGHTLGLNHDGQTGGVNYYEGHGTGDTGWAPIMGTAYYKPVSQWSRGEYTNANNPEDDLDRMTRVISYRTDDFGNDASSATPLVASDGASISTQGLIE
ncbi:MAG: hypothetical protein KDA60_20750, partial [Planctomycetales bacterium]|nr:hypothetical protein [Planctomycetales bacterium]